MSKEVFIKYNPYRLQTEIKIDGNLVKQRSRLNVGEKYFQDWIDRVPEYITYECNTTDFEIVFYGTKLDYEDLKEVSDEAGIKTKYLSSKENIENKESRIRAVFEKIQNAPIDDLKSPAVIQAFRQAQSNNFEVNVVATKKSGKSTLINSLLSKKLLPSFTRIEDTDIARDEAQAFEDGGNLVEKFWKLDYETMSELNSNDIVSEIHNEKHKAAIFKALEDSQETVVLYIIDGTQIGTGEDDVLLTDISKFIETGSKRSRDRFIFVVNKLDQVDSNRKSIETILLDVKEYLEERGIKNPNIYPASALVSLNIRTLLFQDDLGKDDDVVGDEVCNSRGMVRRFRRNSELHFEKYAPLPKTKRVKINSDLENAIENKDFNRQALIHSGITSIEAAISLYVEKYGKTTRIKNIVDALERYLKDMNELFEKKMLHNKKQKAEIIKLIGAEIKFETELMEKKKEFDALDIDKEFNVLYKELMMGIQRITVETISGRRYGETITPSEAKKIITMVTKKVIEFQEKVKELRNTIQTCGEQLIETYLDKLPNLDKNFINCIERNSLNLMIVNDMEDLISRLSKAEEAVTRWYEPFQMIEHRYINIEEFVTSYQKILMGKRARRDIDRIKKRTKELKKDFNKEFIEFDKILGDNVNKMKEYRDKKLINEKERSRLKNIQKWLQTLSDEVGDISKI